MDDLISRQAAIDALMAWEEDSFWDEECLKHRDEPYWVAPSDVIEHLPSAQPEIIRCKDCTNWDTTWTNDWTPNYHYCPIIDGVQRDYFYCANAERRTDA